MCDYCDFHRVDDKQELPTMPIDSDVIGMQGITYRKVGGQVWLEHWDDSIGDHFSTLANYCCICGRKF